MLSIELAGDPRLQRALQASYEYWSGEDQPVEQRLICFRWIKNRCRARFGMALTRAQFDRLWRLGLLEKADTSRGGDRRYYRLCDPEAIRCLVERFRQN